MYLQVTIMHSFFGGESKEVFYIGPQELQAGADIASHFREDERAMFSPLTAKFVDDETVEITWRDKSSRYSIWESGCFSTESLSKDNKTVIAEGEEYDNDHEITAYVRIKPHIVPLWRILNVTCGNETVSFPCEDLRYYCRLEDKIHSGKHYDWLKGITATYSRPSSLTLQVGGSEVKDITLDCRDISEVEIDGVTFSLVSDTSVIHEWDMMEDRPLTFSVPTLYLKAAEKDPDAAYLLAECVQEQYPEALEVIARYMRAAYRLGSAEAEEWLKDYLSDDGRYDAYC